MVTPGFNPGKMKDKSRIKPRRGDILVAPGETRRNKNEEIYQNPYGVQHKLRIRIIRICEGFLKQDDKPRLTIVLKNRISRAGNRTINGASQLKLIVALQLAT